MLHPSYTDLMKVVNADVEEGDTPVVNSRYSIVLATAKRARQIIDGAESDVVVAGRKPLSVAVEEMAKGKLKILPESEAVMEAEDNGEEISVEETAKLEKPETPETPEETEE